MPDPTSPEFWSNEAQKLFEVLFPLFSDAASDSARSSYDDLAGMAELGISWDVFNQDAITWAERNTIEVVSQISSTSMGAFLENYEDWVKSGDPLSALVEALAPYYGPGRAEAVAVTEVTRAYALGNLAVWQRSGMVTGYNVYTAEDDIVCSICEDEQAGNPHQLDVDGPPYHVRCRCYLQPELDEQMSSPSQFSEGDDLDSFEEEISKGELETVGVYKDGQLVLSKTGTRSSIDFDSEELSLMKGAVTTHNHPNNGNFSIDDIMLFFNTQQSEMRVVRAMDTIVISNPKNIAINFNKVPKLMEDAYFDALTGHKQKPRDFDHLQMIQFAKNNKLVYQRIPK